MAKQADTTHQGRGLTPRALEEFRRLFEEWQQEGVNLEALEAGGTGDLPALAQRVRSWAKMTI